MRTSLYVTILCNVDFAVWTEDLRSQIRFISMGVKSIFRRESGRRWESQAVVRRHQRRSHTKKTVILWRKLLMTRCGGHRLSVPRINISQAMPKCRVHCTIGPDWGKPGHSYSAYNLTYQPQKTSLDSEPPRFHPMQANVGMGINLRPPVSLRRNIDLD